MTKIKNLIFILNLLIFGSFTTNYICSMDVISEKTNLIDSDSGSDSEPMMSFDDLEENLFKDEPEEPELIKLINLGDTNGVVQAVSKGADINSKSNSGKSAIQLAMDNNLIDIVQFLSSKSAKASKALMNNAEFKKAINSKLEFPIHNLCIFFDNYELLSNKINTPVVNQFFIAQYQKAAPIIVSENTLKLSMKILSEFKKGNILDDDLKGLSHISELSNIEWDLYKINNSELYLLIPKSYLKNLIKEYETCSFLKNLPKNLSKEEVIIGFCINNKDLLEKIDIDVMKDKLSVFKEINHKNVNKDINISSLKSIFINREYLNSIIEEKIPFIKNNIINNLMGLWNIYLAGHGGYSKNYLKKIESEFESKKLLENETDVYIAGLNINQFQELINIFDISINVNFFYYLSCYAGGYNLMLPYQYLDFNNKIKKKFPNFTIVVASITDSVATVQKFLSGEVSKLKKINLIDFFNELNNSLNRKSIKPVLYDNQKLENILFCIVPQDIDSITISSYPQIMLPGTGIFKILTNKGIEEITDELIISSKKDINIEDKNALLVRSTVVPSKVRIFNKSKVLVPAPIMISMIPGVALHKFDEVEAEKISFLDFFKRTMFSIKTAFPKYFYFKKLILSDEASKVILSNVFVKVQENSMSGAFINGDKVYFDSNLGKTLSSKVSLKNLLYRHDIKADEIEGINDYLKNKEIGKLLLKVVIEKLLNVPKDLAKPQEVIQDLYYV